MPENNWLRHVKAVQEQHPTVPYKQILVKAQATYKKTNPSPNPKKK